MEVKWLAPIQQQAARAEISEKGSKQERNKRNARNGKNIRARPWV
jgi:hypothetical protein